MRKLLSLVLALLLGVGLSGCNENSGGGEKDNKITRVIKSPIVPPGSPEIAERINIARKKQGATSGDAFLRDSVAYAKNADDYVALAAAAWGSLTMDFLAKEGLKAAVSADDVIKLSKAAYNNNVKDKILVEGAHHAKNIDEVIAIAKTACGMTYRDAILYNARSMVKSHQDLDKLVSAAYSSKIAGEIARSAPRIPPGAAVPSKEIEDAYKEMQMTYNAYQNGIKNNLPKNELLKLANNHKEAKIRYDSLIKNRSAK